MSGASDVRAGGAYVEIFAKREKLTQQLAAVESRLSSFGGFVGGIGRKIAAGAAGLFAGGGLGAAAVATDFAQLGSEINDAANRTGLGTEAFAELSYAAKLAGSDAGTLEKSIIKMRVALASAAQGSPKAAAALKAVGLSIEQIHGLDGDQQFQAIAAALSQIEDPAERTKAAMGLFGKSAIGLLPLLNEGSDGIAKFRDEAKKLGYSFDGKDVANADELGDSMDRLATAARATVFQIGAALAPHLIELSKIITNNVAAVAKLIRENPGLVTGFFAAAGAAAAVGVALMGTGLAIKSVAFGIGAIPALIGGLFAPLAGVVTKIVAIGAALIPLGAAIGTFLISPLGIATVLAVAGIGYIIYQTGAAVAAMQALGAGFATVSADVTTAWGGIVAAFSSGDLAAAGQIAFALLDLEFQRLTSAVSALWDEFTGYILDAWSIATQYIANFGIDAFSAIETAWIDMTGVMFGAWDSFLAGFRSMWNDASSFVGQGILYLMSLFDSKISFSDASQELTNATAEQNKAFENDRKKRQTARDEAGTKRKDAIKTGSDLAKSGVAAITEQQIGSRDEARRKKQQDAEERIRKAQEDLAKASADAQNKQATQEQKTTKAAGGAIAAAKQPASTAKFAELTDIRSGGLKAVFDSLQKDETQEHMLEELNAIKDLMGQQVAVANETKDVLEDQEALAAGDF